MKTRYSNWQLIKKMLILVSPLKGLMARAIISGIIGHLCAIFLVSTAVSALVHWIETGDLPLTYLVVLAVLGIVRGVFRYVEQYANHDMAFRTLALIRDRVYGHLRKLAPAKLEEKSGGDLMSLITTDIELLEVFYAHTISPVAIALGVGVVMIIYVASFHWVYGLVLFISFVLIGWVIPMLNEKWGRAVGNEYRGLMGQLSAFILDGVRGRRVVEQYAGETAQLDKLSCLSNDLRLAKSKARNHESLTGMADDLVIYGQLLVSIALSGILIQNGLSPGHAVIPVVTMMSSFGPVLALSSLSNNLMQTLASSRRVVAVLDEPPQVEEVVQGKSIQLQKQVSFERVSFAYGREQVVEDLNLNIPVQGKLGIMGPSGCGKSTLLKLMQRFWDPQDGQVKAEGVPLPQIQTANLHEQYSYMTQSTHLFEGTIEENLRLANPSATFEEVVEAAKKASIHDAIMNFPEGYDTPVSSWGGSLSAGERQRMALARVLLRKSPMMLLDEPTANIDSLNEGIILSALAKEGEHRGMVLVTHKPSTLSIVDRVWSMQE